MHTDRVGPYELVERLGIGGMAETFIAVRRGPGGFEQRVCIKRILEARANDPAFVGPFLDEARLLARMRCANIVQVHDFGEARGTYYMALELVEGVDLDVLLRDARASRDPLPLDASLYVAAELLAAIAYAHELTDHGVPLTIIHRDISPSNLLLSVHGEVKLTDFGIAKARGRVHQTKTGVIKGKLPYMSPEQVRGDSLTQSTDLFSTGVLLYELLSGEHPFEGAADAVLVRRIMIADHRSLREVAPTLPAEISEIVESMMSVSPQRRPASARVALAQLSAHVKFVAGQQLLAERVARCLARRERQQPPQTRFNERALAPYDVQRPVARGQIVDCAMPTKPNDDAGQYFARTAKNTTSRPLRRARVLHWFAAFGALSALGYSAAVWVAERPSAAAPTVASPSVHAPPVRSVDIVEPKVRLMHNAALAPAMREPSIALDDDTVPLPPREAEPLSAPPARSARMLPSASVRARPAPRAARTAKESVPARAIDVRADAGAHRGRWSGVTADQF